MNTTVEDAPIPDLASNRYDLATILRDNKFPRFTASSLVDWNEARFYSVIDLDQHPLKDKCMVILQSQLQRIKDQEEGKQP